MPARRSKPHVVDVGLRPRGPRLGSARDPHEARTDFDLAAQLRSPTSVRLGPVLSYCGPPNDLGKGDKPPLFLGLLIWISAADAKKTDAGIMTTKPPPPPEHLAGGSASIKADKSLAAPKAAPAKDRRRFRPGL